MKKAFVPTDSAESRSIATCANPDDSKSNILVTSPQTERSFGSSWASITQKNVYDDQKRRRKSPLDHIHGTPKRQNVNLGSSAELEPMEAKTRAIKMKNLSVKIPETNKVLEYYVNNMQNLNDGNRMSS